MKTANPMTRMEHYMESWGIVELIGMITKIWFPGSLQNYTLNPKPRVHQRGLGVIIVKWGPPRVAVFRIF